MGGSGSMASTVAASESRDEEFAEPVAAANGLGCHADSGAVGTPAGGTSQVLSVRHKNP